MTRQNFTIIILLSALLSMFVIVKNQKKMKRPTVVCLSIAATSIAATSIAVIPTTNLFLEYTLEPFHILTHLMFSTILVLFATILINTQMINLLRVVYLFELNVFDRAQYVVAQALLRFFGRAHVVELNVFDRTQYILVKKILSLSSIVRKIQTGNLNMNFLGIVVGFIIGLFMIF